MAGHQHDVGSQPSSSMAGQQQSQVQAEKEAWASVVLSLDGGGVRGLSSLYILRDIMQRIKDLDDEEEDVDNRLETGPGLPLPCNYFDFIIGTSTGGLIAVMLGRLRMDVEDCIQQYWVMTIKIFRPYHIRFLRPYSRRTLQESTKAVARAYCGCHSRNQRGDCDAHDYFRQYDFEEAFEQGPTARKNKTCKVAVLTVRERGVTDFQRSRGDVEVLFRSYNHRARRTGPGIDRELRPKSLHHAKLKIHEACSATTAAPTYFHSVLLRGRKYIDGGVWANNPAVVAWNEAVSMAESPNNKEGGEPVKPQLLLSIGTGRRNETPRIKFVSLLHFGLRSITSTRKDEEAAFKMVEQTSGSTYFRFDVHVPETTRSSDGDGPRGLDKIGLAECKKKKIGGLFGRKYAAARPQDEEPQPPSPFSETHGVTAATTAIRSARNRDMELRQRAAANPENSTDFDPQAYTYRTFDKIRDRTIDYLYRSERERIESCARLLRIIARDRKQCAAERWQDFRQHPDPSFRPTNAQVQVP